MTLKHIWRSFQPRSFNISVVSILTARFWAGRVWMVSFNCFYLLAHFSYPWYDFASHGLPAIAELLVNPSMGLALPLPLQQWCILGHFDMDKSDCRIKGHRLDTLWYTYTNSILLNSWVSTQRLVKELLPTYMCLKENPEPWDIMKYFQQIWTNIKFWYRESPMNLRSYGERLCWHSAVQQDAVRVGVSQCVKSVTSDPTIWLIHIKMSQNASLLQR